MLIRSYRVNLRIISTTGKFEHSSVKPEVFHELVEHSIRQVPAIWPRLALTSFTDELAQGTWGVYAKGNRFNK